MRVETVFDERTIDDWKRAHNEIIPNDPLTTDEVRERIGRNHLEVAYLGDTLVGCTTVRPPADDSKTVTIIVRVLPEFRRQGLGTQLYDRARAYAQSLEPQHIETIVWEPNTEGLRFAHAKGFTSEVDRYQDYVTLRR